MSVPHTDQILDEYGRGVPGAQIYVTDTLTLGNAQLTIDGTAPLAQPVIADEFGFYTYWANDGIYREDVYYAGKLRYKGLAYIGVPPQIKGDPGGTADRFGLFSAAATFSIPAGIDIAGTTGFNTIGVGAAEYVHDAAVDAAYVATNPLTSFRDVNGRGFRLRTDQAFVDIKALGAGNGLDDTAAFRAALLLGVAIAVPPAEYNITGSLTLPTGARLFGAGIEHTIINSNIPGDSLFKTIDNTAFLYIGHMRLNGNGIVGAGGSGHCINWMDPDTGGGSTVPQNSQLEFLQIDGFQGTDDADNAGIIKIASCGVLQYSTIQNTCRYVYVSDCGNSFYARSTQNCRFEDCVADTAIKACFFSYSNVNLVVTGCDFVVGNTDGVIDPGYPTSLTGTGLFVSYLDINTVVRDTKMKNYNGDAMILVKQAMGVLFSGCWLRGVATADIVHKTFYADTCTGLKFHGCVFDPSTSNFAATRKYQTIEIFSGSSAPAVSVAIENCVFKDVAGQGIEYNIKLGGNSTARTIKASIRNNTFGTRSSVSVASTVDTDILVNNCKLVASEIGYNLHLAPANITRTVCVTASSFAKSKTKILPSEFEPSGGAITANYSGINETVLWGSVAYNPAAMTTATRLTTTVPVPGVTLGGLGYSVKLSLSADQLGVSLWGYVSGTDTVTAVFENNTGATKDINSAVIYARCEEYQG